MKILKFNTRLTQQVLHGTKRSTWRVFDDKKLSAGDHLTLVNSDTGEEFAKAVIESVDTKTLGDMFYVESKTHEAYDSIDQMVQEFRGYYGDIVDASTEVKVIEFFLI
jgi:hypothetical protein